MNGAVLLLAATAYFVVAYVWYGRFLDRMFGVDSSRPTPATTRTDGVDYVPTPLPVLFGHHFASIAGAGPIVGPVLAIYLGWVPTVLWIAFGCVFIGAMHDFAALFLSVREEGRSIGHIIEKLMGYSGRQIFLLFCWAALVLVVTIFALLVAKTFVANPAVATASLLFVAMAPLFGWLVYKQGLSLVTGSLIFVPALFAAVWVGSWFPLDLEALFGCSPESARTIWLLVLFAYVFVASTIPVWLLLQPRDYLNSYLLYAMMLLGFLGILVAMPTFRLPAFAGWSAVNPKGSTVPVFPLLFVTVACGACSGFHALVCSGTTSKQISNERHIRPVGYGGMIVEGVLAVIALISVAFLTRTEYNELLVAKSSVSAFASGLASFVGRLGVPEAIGGTFIALAISAFLLTSLDTATRLTRFTWQELLLPRAGRQDQPMTGLRKFFSNAFVATLLSVAAAGYLAFSGDGMTIWPVFGASNQLLAALTLLAVTLYLIKHKRNCLVALLPLLFMLIISGWALVVLLLDTWGKNAALSAATVFLLVMALVLVIQAVAALKRARREANTEPEESERAPAES